MKASMLNKLLEFGLEQRQWKLTIDQSGYTNQRVPQFSSSLSMIIISTSCSPKLPTIIFFVLLPRSSSLLQIYSVCVGSSSWHCLQQQPRQRTRKNGHRKPRGDFNTDNNKITQSIIFEVADIGVTVRLNLHLNAS
jgi:hypothetical protein